MTVEEKCNIIIAMLDEQKSSSKNQKTQQLDFSKIESISEQLESSINATSSCTARMEGVIEEVRKPIISERRITIDIASKGTLFIFIGMLIIISGLSSWLYIVTRPNYDRIGNDLKYRYIKMKGEATPQRISDLEDLFEINRDNTKIRQMNKDVEDYERAVKEKATLDEQARLRQMEAERVNREANAIKSK